MRGLCLMKWSSKTGHIFVVLRNPKFLPFTIILYLKSKQRQSLKSKTIVYWGLEYGKFWSNLLGWFIKYKSLISEECVLIDSCCGHVLFTIFKRKKKCIDFKNLATAIQDFPYGSPCIGILVVQLNSIIYWKERLVIFKNTRLNLIYGT